MIHHSDSLTVNPGVVHRDVDADSAGQRLDNFLLACLKGVPRSHIYRLVRSGQVRVNSKRTAPSYRLSTGDRIRIPPIQQKQSRPLSLSPDDLAWLERRIVFEDHRLLVLDKPSGLAVHGGSGVNLGCVEALRVLRPAVRGLELVHRLDKATSGCLMVAKRRSTLRFLHGLLREHRVDKRYLALVHGHWPPATRVVDAPLKVTHLAGEARVRVDSDGVSAISRFSTVKKIGRSATLVEVAIDTGRTHQIRVHAAHLGHPIVGDERYGDPELDSEFVKLGLRRMFLHASSVSFEWPDSRQAFGVCVPLSGELSRMLEVLRVDKP